MDTSDYNSFASQFIHPVYKVFCCISVTTVFLQAYAYISPISTTCQQKRAEWNSIWYCAWESEDTLY